MADTSTVSAMMPGPSLHTNQLIIRVDGWHDISPVAVDSVGTYFRLARRVRPESTSVLVRVCLHKVVGIM